MANGEIVIVVELCTTGSYDLHDQMGQMATARYFMDKAKSFVIVTVLNTPSSNFYFSSATQIMRMLSPEGLAEAERLIVPVMNEGGKFLSSFEWTKDMIDVEI